MASEDISDPSQIALFDRILSTYIFQHDVLLDILANKSMGVHEANEKREISASNTSYQRGNSNKMFQTPFVEPLLSIAELFGK